MKYGIEGEPSREGAASSFDCHSSSEVSSSDAAFRERVSAAAVRLRKHIGEASMPSISNIDGECPKTPQLTPRSEVSSTREEETGTARHNAETFMQDAKAAIATMEQAAMVTMAPAAIRMTEVAARMEVAVARVEEIAARAEATEIGGLSPTSSQASSQCGTLSHRVVPSSAFGGGVGDGRGGPEGLREWMQEAYAKGNPENVARVDFLLDEFRTNEHMLIGNILTKYGHLGIGLPARWSRAQMGIGKRPKPKTPVLGFSSAELAGFVPKRAVSTAASMAETQREAQALCRDQTGAGTGATTASRPAKTVPGGLSFARHTSQPATNKPAPAAAFTFGVNPHVYGIGKLQRRLSAPSLKGQYHSLFNAQAGAGAGGTASSPQTHDAGGGMFSVGMTADPPASAKTRCRIGGLRRRTSAPFLIPGTKITEGEAQALSRAQAGARARATSAFPPAKTDTGGFLFAPPAQKTPATAAAFISGENPQVSGFGRLQRRLSAPSLKAQSRVLPRAQAGHSVGPGTTAYSAPSIDIAASFSVGLPADKSANDKPRRRIGGLRRRTSAPSLIPGTRTIEGEVQPLPKAQAGAGAGAEAGAGAGAGENRFSFGSAKGEPTERKLFGSRAASSVAKAGDTQGLFTHPPSSTASGARRTVIGLTSKKPVEDNPPAKYAGGFSLMAPSVAGGAIGFSSGREPPPHMFRASSVFGPSSEKASSPPTSAGAAVARGFGSRINTVLPRASSVVSAWPAGKTAGAPMSETSSSGTECVLFHELCENMITDSRSGSRCTSGHALCADCTTQYVEKTLLPRGTVWWDRIRCVDPDCDVHMVGLSVQRCLGSDLRSRIDAAQLDVVPMIGPEARRERERAARTPEDRASATTVATTTKPCPNCEVATEKNRGCKHMVCSMCNHEYCWICRSEWTPGHLGDTCVPCPKTWPKGSREIAASAHRSSPEMTPRELASFQERVAAAAANLRRSMEEVLMDDTSRHDRNSTMAGTRSALQTTANSRRGERGWRSCSPPTSATERQGQQETHPVNNGIETELSGTGAASSRGFSSSEMSSSDLEAFQQRVAAAASDLRRSMKEASAGTTSGTSYIGGPGRACWRSALHAPATSSVSRPVTEPQRNETQVAAAKNAEGDNEPPSTTQDGN
ncbi:unnamed protein product [Ectocarpus sp. 4 AP-2014]